MKIKWENIIYNEFYTKCYGYALRHCWCISKLDKSSKFELLTTINYKTVSYKTLFYISFFPKKRPDAIAIKLGEYDTIEEAKIAAENDLINLIKQIEI
jgi:hypothetical protein